MSADEAAPDEARTLGEQLLPDLIILAVSLGLQLVVLGLLSRGDTLTRGWTRLQRAVSGQRDRDRADVVVAQFRRELAAWEHEQAGR